MNCSDMDNGKESEMNPDDDETDDDIIMQDPLSIVAVNYDEDANKEDCGKNDRVILQDYGEDGGDPTDGLVYDPEVLGYDAGSTHMANPFNAYHPFRTSLPTEMNSTTTTANGTMANMNGKRIEPSTVMAKQKWAEETGSEEQLVKRRRSQKSSYDSTVSSAKGSGKRAETATERKKRLELARRKRLEKTTREDPEAKRRRLEKKASYKKRETSMQREARLKRERLHKAKVRAAETADQHAARLKKDREHTAQARALHSAQFWDSL